MKVSGLLLRWQSSGYQIRNCSVNTTLRFMQKGKMVGPNVKLRFAGVLTPCDPQLHPVTIVGLPKNLAKVTFDDVKSKLGTRVSAEVFAAAAASVQSSPEPCPLYLNLATLAPLPSKCSRHNTPSRAHALSKIIRSSSVGVDEYILVVCEKNDVFPSACAIARAFPEYNRKTNGSNISSEVKSNNALEEHGSGPGDSIASTVTVEFLIVGSEEKLSSDDLQCCQDAANAVRLAARIVDAPCNEMNTDTFIEEIKRVGSQLNIKPTIIRGEELNTRGFGGIYGVGKAAAQPPALAVLSHRPAGALYNVAWVGKGIVYDTGGLSLKGKTAMPGMKRDCGGAAGVLGAFSLAVKQGFNQNLHAIFCLAENAVGPLATRPDDIHTLYSGRTVEINNTDAEGRLVLADGVVFAKRDLKCDVILDMATLTGAQGIATGKYHAAVLTNSEEWEDALVVAGKSSGDLTFPMVYCPELHFNEFASAVADMKNSVTDRNNALASCSALFIQAHLGFDYPGAWIHVDMASPVHVGERATGYGVALLASLFGQYSGSALLKALAPSIDVQKLNKDAGNEKEEGTNAKKMRLL